MMLKEMSALLYSLQGSIGQCNAPKPGALDFVGKAKWNAWNDLGSLTQVCVCAVLNL